MSLRNQTPQELVYELVKSLNPDMVTKGITMDMMEFGVPSNLTGGEPFVDPNTSLLLKGITAKNTKGEVEVKYLRLDMLNLFPEAIPLDAPAATKSSDLLPIIQSTYGLIIPESDIYPDDVISGLVHTIRFNGSSFAWIGELNVKLGEEDTRLDLAEIITTTTLTGLTYPSENPPTLIKPETQINQECNKKQGGGDPQPGLMWVGDTGKPIYGNHMVVATNNEIVLCAGFEHAAAQADVIPDANGVYDFSLKHNEICRLVLSISVPDKDPQDLLTDLYDISLVSDDISMRLVSVNGKYEFVYGEQPVSWTMAYEPESRAFVQKVNEYYAVKDQSIKYKFVAYRRNSLAPAVSVEATANITFVEAA